MDYIKIKMCDRNYEANTETGALPPLDAFNVVHEISSSEEFPSTQGLEQLSPLTASLIKIDEWQKNHQETPFQWQEVVYLYTIFYNNVI